MEPPKRASVQENAPARSHQRYLNHDNVQGDIAVAYAPTIDPAKADLNRRMKGMTKAGIRGAFGEEWARLAAPDVGSLFAPISTMSSVRLPDPEVLTNCTAEVELPACNALHTGTDFDRKPAELTEQLLARLSAAHWSRQQGATQGLSLDADVSTAQAAYTTNKILSSAYSLHVDDAMSMLPTPLRGAHTATESRPGAGKALAEQTECAGGTGPDIDLSSPSGVLSHIGKALASGRGCLLYTSPSPRDS